MTEEMLRLLARGLVRRLAPRIDLVAVARAGALCVTVGVMVAVRLLLRVRVHRVVKRSGLLHIARKPRVVVKEPGVGVVCGRRVVLVVPPAENILKLVRARVCRVHVVLAVAENVLEIVCAGSAEYIFKLVKIAVVFPFILLHWKAPPQKSWSNAFYFTRKRRKAQCFFTN